MNKGNSPELRVTACLPFQSGSGFALPLLSGPADNWWVQDVDEASNIVTGFRKLEGETRSAILIDDGPIVKAGKEYTYVFIADDGIAHTGTLNQIETILSNFIIQHPDKIAIALQIAELIGTKAEKRLLRAKMRRLVADSSGEPAAYQFHEGSVLRTALWSRLLSAAPNAEATQRILNSRTQIGVRLGLGGIVSLDLSALNPSDYSGIPVEQIVAELEEEFDLDVVENISFKTTDTETEPSLFPIGSEKISRTLEKLRAAPRQEERIAIMIDEIIQNREVGLAALAQHSDKAKFARRAIQDLYLAVQENSNPSADEIILAHALDNTIKYSFPLRRGELMYYLAKHLANHRIINSLLQSRLDKTRSVFVEPYREAIQKLLSAGRKRTRGQYSQF